jgi:integrase
MEEFKARHRNHSKYTKIHYSKLLLGFWRSSKEIGLTKAPSRWTLEDIMMFLEARSNCYNGIPKANKSIRDEISLLNKFLRFCNNYNLHKGLEYGDVRLPPNTRSHRRWKNLDDIIRLRVQARESEDYTTLIVMQLALDVYLRIGEITRLELSDLMGTAVLVRQGKGRKDREVSITERTRLDLDHYISGPRAEMLEGKSNPSLLLFKRKGLCRSYNSPDSLSKRVRDLGHLCNPPIAVSPHDLRRSGAQLTYLANPTDKTVRDLQSALGHTTTEQTREYIGAAVVDQQATIRTRDRYFAQLYPNEFGQSATDG